jgi:hypothetical protein
MTLPMIAFAIALLPFYFAIRWPFFSLALHRDTGFYVANSTICSGSIQFERGWNATYAGCSKVVPEFFYSLIYLLHGGGDQYKFYSRFYYSFYCYLVAIMTGYLAYMMEGSISAFYAGSLIFALLSSEPHYGVYFESGEQFELLPQVAGLAAMYAGVTSGQAWIAGAGVGLWVLESLFIKLSSLPAAVILGVGVGYLLPPSMLFSLCFSLAAAGLYIAWLRHNGKSLADLLRPMIGHERYSGHKLSIDSYLERIVSKVAFLLFITFSHPIIPILAMIGCVANRGNLLYTLFYLVAVSIPFTLALDHWAWLVGRRKRCVLLLYFLALAAGVIPSLSSLAWSANTPKVVLLSVSLCGVFVCYVIQAARVWYYTLPFLPVIALLATSGAMALLEMGTVGWVTCFGLLVLWLVLNWWRSYAMDLEQREQWTWVPHRVTPDKNCALNDIAPQLREVIGKRTLLIYGLYNQGYVLLETSYPVPMVAPSLYLDLMHPDWQKELHERMVHAPPAFVLDSDRSFDPQDLAEKTALRYELVREFECGFQLFALRQEQEMISCSGFAHPSPGAGVPVHSNLLS